MENDVNVHKLNYVSVVKGLAIFLMLWGHCIQYCSNNRFNVFDDLMFKIIYSFHMPLFMLISGFLMYYSSQKRGTRELIIHRTNRLLYPIITCTFLNFFLTTGVKNLFHNPSLNVLLSGAWLKDFSPFWFLWGTLVASFVSIISFKNNRCVAVKVLLVLLGFIFAAIMPCATTNIYMLPYFLCGYIFNAFMNKYEQVYRFIVKCRWIAIVAFPILLSFYSRDHFIYTTGIFASDIPLLKCVYIDLFRWLIGFVGSIAVLTIVYELIRHIGQRTIANRFLSIFEELGDNSLEYYCISVVILSGYLRPIFSAFTSKLGIDSVPDYKVVYWFVVTPLVSVLYCVLIHLIVKILKRIKLHKYIFG
ncbi:acyltransferase family protein [bacterium]|nr:acyltransferase family protein [bacterium]